MDTTWWHWLEESMAWIEASGWLGLACFIALYALTCIFFLPGSALTVGAGAVYGFWWGTLLVVVSSTVGAVVNFLLARYVLRGLVLRYLAGSPKFLSLDRAVEREGWKIILVSRISPMVPHSLVSYLAGVTRISCPRFTLASMLGFLPISTTYCYAGALLGSLARSHGTWNQQNAWAWFFYGVGLAVTIAVVAMTARLATRALRQSVPEE